MEIFGEQHSSLKSTHHRRSRVRRSMQFVRTIHALLSFNHSCSCRSTDCTALGTLYALKGTMRDLDSRVMQRARLHISIHKTPVCHCITSSMLVHSTSVVCAIVAAQLFVATFGVRCIIGAVFGNQLTE